MPYAVGWHFYTKAIAMVEKSTSLFVEIIVRLFYN